MVPSRHLFALIPNSEPGAAVLRPLQFIYGCDGVVFHRNAAVAAGVYDQIILAETELPSLLAGLEESCGCKVGPVRVAHLKILINLLMRLRDGESRFGEVTTCDNRNTRCDK